MKQSAKLMGLVLGGDFTEAAYQMISGQEVAQSNRYKITIGKSGRIWLYSTGDNIYVQGGPKSDGFGGATLTFELENGCDKVVLKGPWHSNSNSLFDDTGIDLRAQHLTWGVIGRGRDWNGGRAVVKELIYFDDVPTYGEFSRIEKLATKLSHEYKIPLCFYQSSLGGSSCGFVNHKEYSCETN